MLSFALRQFAVSWVLEQHYYYVHSVGASFGFAIPLDAEVSDLHLPQALVLGTEFSSETLPV